MLNKQMKVKKAIITVAGLGTRFLPTTKVVPKELLPILNKPVIQYLIEEMANSGVEEVILVNSPEKKAINDYFKRDLRWEKEIQKKGKGEMISDLVNLLKKVKITVVYQTKPLGNGHAVLQARKKIGNEPFIMSDGDSIIASQVPVAKQVIEVFNKIGSSVIGVQKISDKKEMTKYGNVYTSEKLKVHKVYKVQKIIEKPTIENVSPDGLIVGGMRYVFTADIWPILAKLKVGRAGEVWLADAADILAKTKDLFAYVYEGTYFDTGTPEGLLKTANYFTKNK